jgi:hypothetical protein
MHKTLLASAVVAVCALFVPPSFAMPVASSGSNSNAAAGQLSGIEQVNHRYMYRRYYDDCWSCYPRWHRHHRHRHGVYLGAPLVWGYPPYYGYPYRYYGYPGPGIGFGFTIH